jgi:hypothetical protein
MNPEQHSVYIEKWKLHHHCKQERKGKHGQEKAEGGKRKRRRGMETSSSLLWSGGYQRPKDYHRKCGTYYEADKKS